MLEYVQSSLILLRLWLHSNSALPEQFGGNDAYGYTETQRQISEISIYYREIMLEIMRAAARRAALFIIARYGEGDMAAFPRDLIKLIANEVWKTRLDDIWMDASKEQGQSDISFPLKKQKLS